MSALRQRTDDYPMYALPVAPTLTVKKMMKYSHGCEVLVMYDDGTVLVGYDCDAGEHPHAGLLNSCGLFFADVALALLGMYTVVRLEVVAALAVLAMLDARIVGPENAVAAVE